jgi:hypothetical protein
MYSIEYIRRYTSPEKYSNSYIVYGVYAARNTEYTQREIRSIRSEKYGVYAARNTEYTQREITSNDVIGGV